MSHLRSHLLCPERINRNFWRFVAVETALLQIRAEAQRSNRVLVPLSHTGRCSSG